MINNYEILLNDNVRTVHWIGLAVRFTDASPSGVEGGTNPCVVSGYALPYAASIATGIDSASLCERSTFTLLIAPITNAFCFLTPAC